MLSGARETTGFRESPATGMKRAVFLILRTGASGACWPGKKALPLLVDRQAAINL